MYSLSNIHWIILNYKEKKLQININFRIQYTVEQTKRCISAVYKQMHLVKFNIFQSRINQWCSLSFVIWFIVVDMFAYIVDVVVCVVGI